MKVLLACFFQKKTNISVFSPTRTLANLIAANSFPAKSIRSLLHAWQCRILYSCLLSTDLVGWSGGYTCRVRVYQNCYVLKRFMCIHYTLLKPWCSVSDMLNFKSGTHLHTVRVPWTFCWTLVKCTSGESLGKVIGFFRGVSKGRGCSWGTLRILFGKIGEP